MPKYGYFCRACAEPYEVRMTAEERESWVPRCPGCGDEGEQELFEVRPDGGAGGRGGCCGGDRSCCG